MDDMGMFILGFFMGKKKCKVGYTANDIIDAIDKMPTLYTYTAGEFSFEFKIEDFLAFNLPFTPTVAIPQSGDDVISLQSYVYADWICKKNNHIICAHREPLSLGTATQGISYDINGNVVYNAKISNIEISNVNSVIVSYAPYFQIYGSFKYNAVNYNTGYTTSNDVTLNGYRMYIYGGSWNMEQLFIFNGSAFDSYRMFYDAVNEIRATLI